MASMELIDSATGQLRTATTADLGGSGGATALDVSFGTGNVDAKTQRVVLAADGPTVTAIGATTNTAAAADGTGNYSVISALKRGLLNWATLLTRIPDLIAGRVPTEILGQPSVAWQLAVTTASASQALTATCRRISIRARGCDMRYVVGTGTQTANATTSHFTGQDERLDIAVPANAVIAAIRESAATANGSLEISELV